MNVKRVNNYLDPRFERGILMQHGGYIIDDEFPCKFLIINKHEAIVDYHDYSNIEEIIDEFRFYSRHITIFYDVNNNLLKEYDEVLLDKVKINELQPSQFFVDESKVDAISTWARKEDDFIIPVIKINNEIIILDGHTRLYLANQLGINEIFIYEDSVDDYISYFVQEAKRRGIDSVKALKVLPHASYFEKWLGFCNEYFNQ
ncbi:ParB N-terminal domain-containing protein [Haloplasma contractile]|uniref:ParB/Sulfiredoxin domain-containing protein n=1 Tax=Haloplasma contractile SSD-17B TaxID=1033810 RepID=F7Q0F0_9MOLU|nr:hypothetical protein [Haloplasma contractile]ERJ12704.1 hypothetical protein HLPCO_001044 [Haloplasma contractile SSD-17B]